jgi:hypothetical protein
LLAWALGAGLGLGVLMRLAMRFVALEACVPPGMSAGGTLEVIAAGAIAGGPIALARLALHRGHPTRWLGASIGLTLFVVLARWPPPAARAALAATPDTPAATAAAFALVFLAWGCALDGLARRRFPPLP